VSELARPSRKRNTVSSYGRPDPSLAVRAVELLDNIEIAVEMSVRKADLSLKIAERTAEAEILQLRMDKGL